MGQFVTESNYTFDVFDHRARLFRAAVGFALLPPSEPELRLLRRRMDTCSGIGHVVAGMARQHDDLGWQFGTCKHHLQRHILGAAVR